MKCRQAVSESILFATVLTLGFCLNILLVQCILKSFKNFQNSDKKAKCGLLLDGMEISYLFLSRMSPIFRFKKIWSH